MSAQHRPRVRQAALAGPLLVLALAGCGAKPAASDGVASAANAANASGKATTTTTMDDEQARLAFTSCLRQRGIQVQDAGPGMVQGRAAGGSKNQSFKVSGKVTEKSSRKMAEAMKACRKYAPNGGQPPKLNPEQIEQSRKMASCMRTHGVPGFPDPDKSGMIKVEAGKAGSEMNPDSPTFQKAMEACRGNAPMLQSKGGPGGPDGPGTDKAGGLVQGGGQ